MRVALISYEYPPDTAFGGIGTYTQQAARILSRSGHSVEVFAASRARTSFEETGNLRINLVGEFDRAAFAIPAAHVFRERHNARPFDVVEGPEFGADGREVLRLHPEVPHVVKMHTPSELVRALTGCPLSARGWMRQKASRARMALGALRRGRMPAFGNEMPNHSRTETEQLELDYVRQCDFTVSPSRAMLDWAVSHWSVDPANSMVVPNPYVPSPALLEMNARKHEGIVVGFIGRLEYRKGLVDLVHAIPQVLQAAPDTCFRFVGRAFTNPATLEPFDVFIKRKLRWAGDRIRIVGARPLEEMPDEYSLLDLCVLPSIWENFPNACLEAMSAGKAVVASRAGGMAEMLEGGGGLLVAPRSPQELAAAIIRLIRAPEIRLAAGEQGRRQVLESYSSGAILPLIENSYRCAILASRNRPRVQLPRTNRAAVQL